MWMVFCSFAIQRHVHTNDAIVGIEVPWYFARTIDIGISIFNSILFHSTFGSVLAPLALFHISAHDFHSMFCYHIKQLNTLHVYIFMCIQ